MEIYIVIAVVCSAVGYAVATEEHKVSGAILGGIFGPFGILIAALLK